MPSLELALPSRPVTEAARPLLLNCLFELFIRLRLDGLGVLQLLDKFELQQLHLHYFLLLMSDLLFFIPDLSFHLQPLLSDLLNFLLFHFPTSMTLIFLDTTFTVLVQFLNVGLLRGEADFALLCTDTGLPSFFLLREDCHLLNPFLLKSMLLLHSVDSVLGLIGPHVIVLHFFNLGTDSLLVFLLEAHDFSGLLLRLLNLLPRLHLLLLQKSNTIGK